MNKVFYPVTLLLVFMITSINVKAQKHGYVDENYILSQLQEVQQAEQQIEAYQKDLQEKGTKMVQDLQNDYLNIQQRIERGELTPAQQQNYSTELEERQQEIMVYEKEMQVMINRKREELLQPILDKVNKAIQEVASEYGYTMIFSSKQLLYASPAVDLSQKVLEKLRS